MTAAVVAALLAGCSGDGAPPDAASAADEAAEELREIRDGIVATDDVEVRRTEIDAQGCTVAELAVTNSGDESEEYVIQVNFHDRDNDLVDVVLVTVSSVAPGDTARATARSHDDLPEGITVEVVMAVRH